MATVKRSNQMNEDTEWMATIVVFGRPYLVFASEPNYCPMVSLNGRYTADGLRAIVNQMVLIKLPNCKFDETTEK